MTSRNELPPDRSGGGVVPNIDPAEAAYRERTRRARNKAGVAQRVKMLVVAGAVAGTVGGWGVMAQNGSGASAQTVPPQPATATVVATTAPATATTTGLATATVGQTQATAAQNTATPTTQPTATAALQAPTAVPPAPVTTTRSSR